MTKAIAYIPFTHRSVAELRAPGLPPRGHPPPSEALRLADRMDALALQRTHTTMVVDSNQGDAPLFRRMAALAAADPRRILHRSMAERGAAKVLRWQSAELRSVAATACARALVLCEHRRRIEGWPGSRHRPPG